MTIEITSNQFALLENGTRLHYASVGDASKPLMLFVHGFPEFWFEWAAQLSAFGSDFHAVAPDLRGFNLSDMPSEPKAYRAKHIIDDLRLFISHCGHEKAIIVAHDWGGAICWGLAIAFPALVEKLIIINSPHPYLFMQALQNDPKQQAASQYMNWLRSPGSELALAKNQFALLEGFFKGMGQGEATWFDAATRARYHGSWQRGLIGGVNYYRASPLHPPTGGDETKVQLDPTEFKVNVPTRVIWGENDKALPASLLNGLEEFVPDLQVVRIPNGSHWVVHEQPLLVNQTIREFVTTLS